MNRFSLTSQVPEIKNLLIEEIHKEVTRFFSETKIYVIIYALSAPKIGFEIFLGRLISRKTED
jgi:hypothetical protein